MGPFTPGKHWWVSFYGTVHPVKTHNAQMLVPLVQSLEPSQCHLFSHERHHDATFFAKFTLVLSSVVVIVIVIVVVIDC